MQYDVTAPAASPADEGKYIVYINRGGSIVSKLSPGAEYVEMERATNWKGGDGTVPDSSASALKPKNGKTKQIGIGTRSDWFGQDHSNVYKSMKAKDLTMQGVTNLALERFMEKLNGAKKG
jgi:hypothetical protein